MEDRPGEVAAEAHPLARLLLDERAGAPDDPVITVSSTSVTRTQARDAAIEIAAALFDIGIGPGDAVATILPSTPAAVVALFGIWGAGAVAVPVNPRLAGAEIARLLETTSVSAVLVPPAEDGAAIVPDGLGRVALTDRVEGSPADPGWQLGIDRVSAVTRRSDSTAMRTPAYESGAAIVLTTSGTTGAPKPVVLDAAKVLQGIDTVLGSLRGSARGRPPSPTDAAPTEGPAPVPPPNLIPVPLALWAGVYNTLFAFRAGAGVVLLDPFSTRTFAHAVRTHDIKSTVLAPAMIAMLSDDPAITDLAPLRIVRSITAPLSPHQARRFHERFGVVVLNSYGQTELGGEVIGWRAADARSFGTQKLGAIGRPHPGIDLRFLDDDTEVGPGEEGELCVRSPSMMQGYATGDTNVRLTADGYLRTGDIGHIDDDGFVWLSGRVSDLIIRGGLKVFPGDVEECLLAHPAIRDVAVVGVPDDRLGEVPWAFVVVDPSAGSDHQPEATLGASLDASLEAHCRQRVAAYKVPARFVHVDALPRNDVGKVLRGDLVSLATATAVCENEFNTETA